MASAPGGFEPLGAPVIPAETWCEVQGEYAEALADVAGELTDIGFARRAIDELLGQWPAAAPYGPDTIGAQALWAAAIVAYARCFGGGVRVAGAAVTLVERLPSDEQADHARFWLFETSMPRTQERDELPKVARSLGADRNRACGRKAD